MKISITSLNIKYYLILISYFLAGSLSISHAQVTSDKPIDGSILSFGIGLGANVPVGVLSDRYGSNLNFSLGGEYITSNNLIFNGEFLYFFGENIKEDVLAPLRSKEGYVLGDDQQYANLILKERGLYLGVGIGKLFPFSKESRSGLKAVVGGGILQHSIHFADDRNSVAQLRAGRYVGYDRLTRGFALKETITYKHLSNNRLLNFEAGFDFIQGFTSEVRKINFDTGLPTIDSRLDLMLGFRLIWNIPYYKGSETTIYY